MWIDENVGASCPRSIYRASNNCTKRLTATVEGRGYNSRPKYTHSDHADMVGKPTMALFPSEVLLGEVRIQILS